MDPLYAVMAAVTVVTVASLWCLPIDIKFRVKTGECLRNSPSSLQ